MVKVAGCVSAAAMLLGTAVFAQAPGDSAGAILSALQQRDYARAIAEADAALRTRPGDCRVLTMRGLALENQGRTGDGLLSYQQALRACPQFIPALEGAAQVYYVRQSPEAKPLLERILVQRPDDVTSNAMMAAIDAREGDCPSALPYFRKSLPLVEKNAAAGREYAACLLATDAHREAVEFLRSTLERDNSVDARLRLAYAQWKAKDDNGALATLTPLLTPASADAKVLALGAQVAEDKGNTPQAVDWLRRAILASPDNLQNYLLFATLSFNHASFPVGVDIVNAGLKRMPQSAQLYLARGVLYVQMSRFDAALQDFEQAHRLDPHLSFAEDAIGMLHSQQHDPAASLAVFEQQIQRHPDDALLQYLYAEALSEKQGDNGAQQKALAAARKAVALEPDYQPANDLLCVLLLRTNDLHGVVQVSQRALQQNPDDEVAVYQQMQAQRRLGDNAAVHTLVDRLNELKKHSQEQKTKYLLQEADNSAARQE